MREPARCCPAPEILTWETRMAKKAASKAKGKTGTRPVLARRVAQAEGEAPKRKSGFGKRSEPTGAGHAKAARSRPAPARRSVIARAVDAVSSTVSTMA